MAAIDEVSLLAGAVAPWQREARGGDAVGRVEGRGEDVVPAVVSPGEKAEQRRVAVVSSEAVEELGVREDATPVFADQGEAREQRWLWREAEKDRS